MIQNSKAFLQRFITENKIESNILDTESTITRTNPNNSVGLIELQKGNFNHDGVIHIAKRRYDEHTNQNEGYPNKTNISTITDEAVKKNLKETTALLFLVADSLSTFHAKAADGRNWYIYGYGLKITVRKKDESKYVVTGFSDDLFEDKRNPEATETINAVIAKYGYTHEFLDLYAHVGAELASSYPNITSQVQEVNKYLLQKQADKKRNLALNTTKTKGEEKTMDMDQKIERMQANGGMSEAAMEADIRAEEERAYQEWEEMLEDNQLNDLPKTEGNTTFIYMRLQSKKNTLKKLF